MMYVLIVVLVAIVVVGRMAFVANRTDGDRAAGVTARFRDLTVTDSEFVEGGREHRRHGTAQLVATVEESGTVGTRMSWLPARVRDGRVVHLTVQGPDTSVRRQAALRLRPQAAAEARSFAAALTGPGRDQGATPDSVPTEAIPTVGRPSGTGSRR